MKLHVSSPDSSMRNALVTGPPIILSGDEMPAPELANAISRRLQECGLGIETGFKVLNVGQSPSGVSATELKSSLSAVFKIESSEEVTRRLVAWGDISGDGRLRYMEFARLIRSATGYSQMIDTETSSTDSRNQSHEYMYEPPHAAQSHGPYYGETPTHSASSQQFEEAKTIGSICETCYVAAQEPQATGGVGEKLQLFSRPGCL